MLKTYIEKLLNSNHLTRKESYAAIHAILNGANPCQISAFLVLLRAKNAGVDGILIVDLPLEESSDYLSQCEKFDMDPIFVISPSTKPERIKQINAKAKGFLYYACRKGTTGMKNDLPSDIKNQIHLIKKTSKLPVVVVFGISSREIAKKMVEYADGVVVGSLFADAIEKGESPEELKKLAKKIDPRGKI